jgi:hypothetical protein
MTVSLPGQGWAVFLLFYKSITSRHPGKIFFGGVCQV